jgi:tRNA threonylcarbamoyladenosine biosynthesis protein TsaE
MVLQTLEVITKSCGETIKVGRKIANFLKEGSVIALTGEMGVGKTYLIKGIAAGLGCQDYVTSPSFKFAQEYQGKLKIHHLDLYRITHLSEIETIGFEEFLTKEGVVIIEWADKIKPCLPNDYLEIEMKRLSSTHRLLRFTPQGRTSREEFTRLKKCLF